MVSTISLSRWKKLTVEHVSRVRLLRLELHAPNLPRIYGLPNRTKASRQEGLTAHFFETETSADERSEGSRSKRSQHSQRRRSQEQKELLEAPPGDCRIGGGLADDFC